MIFDDRPTPHTFVEAFRFIGDNPRLPRSRRRSSSSSSRARRSGSRSLVALPLGIVLGHLHRGSGVAIGTSIVGRALPSLVLIGVFLTVLGIGFIEQHGRARRARDRADPDERVRRRRRRRPRRRRGGARDGHVRAGRSCAAVELPLALPLIFTGIRVAAVTVVATAPIAAIAGGGGLGDMIVEPGELPARGRARRVALRDGAVGGSMARRCLRCRGRPLRRGLRAARVQAGSGTQRKEGM